MCWNVCLQIIDPRTKRLTFFCSILSVADHSAPFILLQYLCCLPEGLGWLLYTYLKTLLRHLRYPESQEKTAPVPWVWSYTRWDSKKTCKKIRQHSRAGWNSGKPSILMATEFHPVFLFSWAPPLLLLHRFSLLLPVHSYYNFSRTLCIKCWISAFRTEFQHFILRFNKTSLVYLYHWKRG